MTKEDAINTLINDKINTNLISDGYHTFGDLYNHRIALWIKLAEYVKRYCEYEKVWRSKKHSDGTTIDGWFVLGIGTEEGEQITYHLPESEWNNCDFAETLNTAPTWDGHTSDDVLKRLSHL